MNTPIARTGALTPSQLAAVTRLVESVSAHDGVRPLNEAGSLALDGRGHAVHWVAHCGGELVGYAQCDRASTSAQLLVAPQHRRKGIGSALAAEVCRVEPATAWWAFGNLAGAQGFASHLGLRLVRELLIMERDLAEHPAGGAPTPEGIVLRPFTDDDAQALVEVNEQAFSHHPEQGEMGVDDFWLRLGEQHPDPEAITVAIDDETGALVGFHWTKTEHSDPAHPDELLGEVYVIGVSPAAGGRGIGRALLDAGLVHLADKGVRRVRLYVEASSERVVRMYESASFVVTHRDASYAR